MSAQVARPCALPRIARGRLGWRTPARTPRPRGASETEGRRGSRIDSEEAELCRYPPTPVPGTHPIRHRCPQLALDGVVGARSSTRRTAASWWRPHDRRAEAAFGKADAPARLAERQSQIGL